MITIVNSAKEVKVETIVQGNHFYLLNDNVPHIKIRDDSPLLLVKKDCSYALYKGDIVEYKNGSIVYIIDITSK